MLLGIPLIVLLTKIDQACSYVGSDVSLVYKSTVIRDIMAMVNIFKTFLDQFEKKRKAIFCLKKLK